MAKKRLAWLQPGIVCGAIVPLLVMGVRLVGGGETGSIFGTLGADPVALLLNQLGHLTLVLLLASLACSPLKSLLDWTWPIRVRRALGLLAFFYACLHFLTYAVVDQSLHFATIYADIRDRPFILYGSLAFLSLVPLAVTSTARMIKRLGFRRWKLLHRLVYGAGILGCLHFYLRVKRDVRQPTIYLGFLMLLLAIRAADAWKRSSSSKRKLALRS